MKMKDEPIRIKMAEGRVGAAGGSFIKEIGDNLCLSDDGILSVDTAEKVEKDNTRPVTSAAVHTEIGNIEALLAAL